MKKFNPVSTNLQLFTFHALHSCYMWFSSQIIYNMFVANEESKAMLAAGLVTAGTVLIISNIMYALHNTYLARIHKCTITWDESLKKLTGRSYKNSDGSLGIFLALFWPIQTLELMLYSGMAFNDFINNKNDNKDISSTS